MMKQITDEEIQRSLDENKSLEPSGDGVLYQKVYLELSKSLDLDVGSFENDVVANLKKRSDHLLDLKISFAVAVTVLLSLSIFIVVSFQVSREFEIKTLMYADSYKWVILFLGVLSAFLILENRKDRIVKKVY